MNKVSLNLSALFLFFLGMSTLFLYHLSSGIPFLFDDQIHIWQAAFMNVESTQYVPSHYWKYRPVLQIIYWLEFKLHGYQIPAMRGLNIVLHSFNVFLFYRLFFRQEFQHKKQNLLLYLTIGFIFFHPILWHSVLYLSARSTLLSTSFILSTIYFYRCTGKLRLLSLVSWSLAFHSKEPGIIALPIALLTSPEKAIEDWKRLQENQRLKQFTFFLFLIGSVSFVAFNFNYVRLFLGSIFNELNNPHEYFGYVQTQGKMFFVYLKNFILPIEWQFTYDLPLFHKIDSLGALWLLSSFSVLGLFFWWAKKQQLFFLGLACFLSMGLEFFYPRGIIGQDQRVYLMYMLLSLFIYRIGKVALNEKKALLLLIPLVLNFGILVDRVNHYKNPQYLHQRAIKVQPNHILSSVEVAHLSFSKGQIKDSIEIFNGLLNSRLEESKRSYIVKKYLQRVTQNLFQIYLALNDTSKAKALLLICKDYKMHPDICLLMWARYYKSQKQFSEALSALENIRKQDSILMNLEKSKIYQLMNRSQESQNIIEDLLLKYPQDEDVITEALIFYLESQQLDSLQSLADKTIRQLENSKENPQLLKKVKSLLKRSMEK